MVDMIVQVSIPYNTQLPEDVSVNTWAFQVADDTQSNFEEVADFLQFFYIGISAFLSPVLNIAATNISMYRRVDATPRVPVFDEIVSMGTGNTGDPLPEEVAVCLSFRGVLTSGTNPARRKGRVFLGPMATSCVTDDAFTRSRIAPACITEILDAYEAGQGQLSTVGNEHVIWSGANESSVIAVNAWVDNAFDTQRRRGPISTFRDSRSSPWT